MSMSDGSSDVCSSDLAGDDNDASIEQRSEDSDALVYQTGSRNSGSIIQREDSPPTENFSAAIYQYGNDGISSIDQDGDNHVAVNEQTGNFDSSSDRKSTRLNSSH